MIKKLGYVFCCVFLMLMVVSCSGAEKTPKIGVSFGVGKAARWGYEKEYMEERAKELGIEIETRMNLTDEPKTQKDDCFEMIDSGIDVLILIPRDVSKMKEITDYAKEKKVKVISYARLVLGEPIDLFVGYDSRRIGQSLGQYLSEMVTSGDYILLKGDPGDYNATLLYEGAVRYIDPLKGDINIILDEAVPGWSPEEAKKMVKDAVAANGNKVDAILAPNDKLAGACAEALKELNVTEPVVITGMDAELDAVKRILAGEQSVTVYMDIKILARTAVEEAYHMAKKEKVNVNAEFDNECGTPINSNLITGQLVVDKNVDKILIESGYYTKEEVYGNQ